MGVDAKSVKELRDKTGLPMMECKRALVDADGDVEKAYENLRKAGLRAVEKLAGREASDGKVAARLSADGKSGVLAALRCETEPVAKNEKFIALLATIADVVERESPADEAALKTQTLPNGDTVEQAVTDLVNQIRENINLGKFCQLASDAVVQYVHFDGKKAAMVALEGGSTSDEKVVEAGKDVCMHIVFERPAALSRAQLDPAIVAKEEEIQLAQMKNDPKNAKKPEEILHRIIAGKMDKFVGAQCLLEQPFVKDPKQTVEKYLQGAGVKLVEFCYIATDL